MSIRNKHRFSSKPLPELPRMSTFPLSADAVQNKALFGGCVSIHEQTSYDRGGYSSGDDEKTDCHRQGSFKYLLQIWWLEILSVFTMCLSLFAIVITLRLHQDEPLPQWPFAISINALLSVYYTVFKGAMLLVISEGKSLALLVEFMYAKLVIVTVLAQLKWAWFQSPRPLYDMERFSEASRGPRGAVQLLWASRGRLRQSILPMFGALLVLLALAIDPFTQQIVNYYNCSRQVLNVNATIPRTNNFTSPSWHLPAYGADGSGSGNITIDLGRQGAMFSGLFKSSAVDASYVPAHCPTGNCTFDPYWSLGMCSSCTDMTSKVSFKCKPYSWWNESSTLHNWPTIAPVCNFSWPYGRLSLSAAPQNYTYPQFNMTGGSIGSRSPNPSLVTFNFLKWTNNSVSGPFSDSVEALPEEAKGVGAATCTLYPCFREYAARVQGGTFEEVVLSSDPAAVIDETYTAYHGGFDTGFVSARIGCLDAADKAALKAMGYNVAMPARWLAIDGPDFATAAEKINSQCLFSMVGPYWPGAGQLFGELFRTESNSNYEGIYGGLPEEYTTSTILHAFYDYGSITFATLNDRFDGIAQSLTSYIRRIPGDVPTHDRSPATGRVWTNDTCVAVRWSWIVLPAALLAFGTFYLALVLSMLARKANQTMWKSSSVAMLSHGLDEPTRTTLSSLYGLSEMEKKSRDISVQLMRSENGWTLTSVGG